MTNKRVLIVGAGPAGLTAGLELLRRDPTWQVTVIEALDDVGGLSRTVNHRGNRMDIGGHRFFSKSDWVMNWWRAMLPEAKRPDGGDPLNHVPDEDRVMLLRSRLSRIYFLRRFFDYPISLNANTLSNLGPVRLVRIGFSYTWSRLWQRKPEKNLEDFFINRFGGELYRTFFRDYTEKVWGVSCRAISPDWGAQRIKGLSVTRAILHALRKKKRQSGDVAQKQTETSLIERFLYPKFGPGQMWQTVARELVERQGTLLMNTRLEAVHHEHGRVTGADLRDTKTGEVRRIKCDHLISTTAIRELFLGLRPPPPAPVMEVAKGLCYRDFITVGLLVRKLRKNVGTDPTSPLNLAPDTWIYIQEPDVRIGRLQIFNNWSPALVGTPDAVWLGLEYFCQEGDDLWSLDDAAMTKLGESELIKIGLLDADLVLDAHVVRVPKAYPAYFGSYPKFPVIREFVDSIDNLYLVGRNGMHRYNNQDHSMLTAKLAAEAILSGSNDRSAIWSINVDDEYHEENAKKSG